MLDQGDVYLHLHGFFLFYFSFLYSFLFKKKEQPVLDHYQKKEGKGVEKEKDSIHLWSDYERKKELSR